MDMLAGGGRRRLLAKGGRTGQCVRPIDSSREPSPIGHENHDLDVRHGQEQTRTTVIPGCLPPPPL